MIVVFGATGFTGRLVVDALVARGEPVRIVGRSRDRLEQLSAHHGGLDLRVADVERPADLKAAIDGAAALVTTVGPFTWWGEPAVEAAIDAGVPYLDSTGEPGFIRRVFERYGPRAVERGIPLITAFGYDYVPGNLAAGLALEQAGGEAVRVDIGYFVSGPRSARGFSAGTMRSLRAAITEPQFAWRDGRLVEERGSRATLEFEFDGRSHPAITIGSSEHLALPQSFPRLTEVNACLGWFGPASRAVQKLSKIDAVIASIPFVRNSRAATAGRAGARRTEPKGPVAGPDPARRRRSGTDVVAIARDQAGRHLATVRVKGPNPYDLTAGLLAWGATEAAGGRVHDAGALGPIEAYGLDRLERGCAEVGLRAVRDGRGPERADD